MAETTSSWQQTTFTDPEDGDALDASVVLGNDNNIRSKHNSHDSDGGIHLQSSVLASRPAAGTAGRKWLTSDTLRLYYDDGSSWDEIAYLPSAVAATLTTTTTPQFTVAYDASNHIQVSVSSAGAVTLNATGASASFSFSDKAAFGSAYPAGYASPLVAIQNTGTQFQVLYDSSNGIGVSVASDGAIILSTFGTDDEIQFVTPKIWFGSSAGTAVAYPDYTAASGTASRATFDTTTVTTEQLAERVKAIIDDMLAFGLFT